MMKQVLKCMLSVIMKLIAIIFTYDFSQRLKRYRDSLYTMWIRNFVGSFGEGSSIAYPCSLQGGGQQHIFIGCHTTIKNHSILGCWKDYQTQDGQLFFSPEIVIGNDCSIGEFIHITAINKVMIGDGLLTGRYVYIGDNSHGGLSEREAQIPPAKRKLQSKGKILIGNNVWIGDKVTILGGVTIGDNVIIGANSVVTKDVTSNTMVAGVPAEIIKSFN